MPKRSRSAGREGTRGQELAAAEHAYARLIEQLQELQRGLERSTRPSARNLSHKALQALQALQRHARIMVATHAFVDVREVNDPHPDLLTVFYSDPNDSVAARYSWALLHDAAPGPKSLSTLIAATRAEHAAFQTAQNSRPRRRRDISEALRALMADEDRSRRKANRLCYTLSVLQRLQLVQRHGVVSPSAEMPNLEGEVLALTEAAEEAHQTLSIARLKVIRAGREGR